MNIDKYSLLDTWVIQSVLEMYFRYLHLLEGSQYTFYVYIILPAMLYERGFDLLKRLWRC